MTAPAATLYAGHVVHKRLRPRAHGFRYRVFAALLDVDRIDEAAASCRIFSRGRTNLVSFFDRDHGRGDGTPVAEHVRRELAAAGLADAGARITLLCYPRILGFVFNPLSVYFCHRAGGELGAVIYEVSNTFCERTSYIIPVADGRAPVFAQRCAKAMYVSPFTEAAGSYGFHVRPPAGEVVVGVDFREAQAPVLKTHFRGARASFSDRSLIAMLARHPMMTAKVVGAIHFEAARLWAKGVPVVRHRPAPAYTSILATNHSTELALHA